MNELTANRRLMKSTYKNILDLMLPPSDDARASTSSSDCFHPPSTCIDSLPLHASRSDRGRQGVEMLMMKDQDTRATLGMPALRSISDGRGGNGNVEQGRGRVLILTRMDA